MHEVDIFEHCHFTELQSIFYSCVQKTIHKGTIIYNEGEKPNSLYIVYAGEVKLTKKFDLVPKEKEEEFVKTMTAFEHGLQRLRNRCHDIDVLPLLGKLNYG